MRRDLLYKRCLVGQSSHQIDTISVPELRVTS